MKPAEASIPPIKRPDFIATPPLPEPVPHRVPGPLTTALVQKPRPVRVLCEADIDGLAPWLFSRLGERHVSFDIDRLVRYLRSVISTRGMLAVIGPQAFGVFESRLYPVEPVPSVIEVFVRRQQGAPKDTAHAIYEFAADWAWRIGASELNFGFDTDTPVQELYAALPKSIKKIYHSLARPEPGAEDAKKV